MRIRTILCPIDFSDLSVRELAIAAELGRAFGARLVLHHNRIAVAPGLARAWDWEASHRSERLGEAEAERRMAAALAAVPADVPAEGVISAGPIGLVVLSLAERVPADLIVIGSHGWSTEEHASITERIIAGAPCPVLSLPEGGERTEPLCLATAGGAPRPRAVVPTDFSPTASAMASRRRRSWRTWRRFGRSSRCSGSTRATSSATCSRGTPRALSSTGRAARCGSCRCEPRCDSPSEAGRMATLRGTELAPSSAGGAP
jgi:universal stress protein A